jgi:hypothetical protein
MFAFTGRKRFISMESLSRHFKKSKTTSDATLGITFMNQPSSGQVNPFKGTVA